MLFVVILGKGKDDFYSWCLIGSLRVSPHPFAFPTSQHKKQQRSLDLWLCSGHGQISSSGFVQLLLTVLYKNIEILSKYQPGKMSMAFLKFQTYIHSN